MTEVAIQCDCGTERMREVSDRELDLRIRCECGDSIFVSVSQFSPGPRIPEGTDRRRSS